jgi:hypothetical protein
MNNYSISLPNAKDTGDKIIAELQSTFDPFVIAIIGVIATAFLLKAFTR